ncbi:Biopolymer transport protein ExbD/TolR [Labilithrix luteola]|uniref:Biopolymer transport protein ExbD/TolR n=1 Tax=Labilithrix luteola TaxID=1391654 RepID=A0A0K1PV14_9BACT|nr:biopolymer transporter ExbD [Labilithrix luteola]AKU96974.1 Biopolymer transport protein ExbD/TolR [Labilithrix luteola]
MARSRGLRTKRTVQAAPVKNEINVTPLVDVVLVLLIIFMVVTPMLHRSPPVELPETAHHEKKQDTGEQLIVTIRADGAYVETDRLEGEALKGRLRQELQKAGRPVHVKADRSLRYGDVRKILEDLHESGAPQIGIGTNDQKG